MSIASEVSRIIDAKAGIKTAIEDKGVTVPAGATLEAYPALIDGISGDGLIKWFNFIEAFSETYDTLNKHLSGSNRFSEFNMLIHIKNRCPGVFKGFTIDSAGVFISYLFSTTGTYINVNDGIIESDGLMYSCESANSMRYRGYMVNWSAYTFIETTPEITVDENTPDLIKYYWNSTRRGTIF